jgi:hypothetical protein
LAKLVKVQSELFAFDERGGESGTGYKQADGNCYDDLHKRLFFSSGLLRIMQGSTRRFQPKIENLITRFMWCCFILIYDFIFWGIGYG